MTEVADSRVNTSKKRRVMIVEDSMVIRRILTDIMNEDDRLQVDWVATDGVDCLEQLKQADCTPDVITLDVEMPNLGGIKTLEELLRIHAIPVLMISSHTKQGEQVTLEALEIGAVDFVAKPANNSTIALFNLASEISKKVYQASFVDMEKVRRMYRVIQKARFPKRVRKRFLILGASTGGPRTLQLILQSFPSDFPMAVLIAQHMPSGFTRELAQRLNYTCRMTVKEASDGDLITPGNVFVAPGGNLDMIIEKSHFDDSAVVRVVQAIDTPEPTPSINRLITSAAETFPQQCIAALLTGMGADGAEGLDKLLTAGGVTIAESEESCIIFGMPKKAIERGAVSVIAPKEEIASVIFKKMAF